MSFFRSTKFQSEAPKVLWISLIWVLFSATQFFFEYGNLTARDCLPSGFVYKNFFIGNILATAIAGLVGGSFIVFYLQKTLRTKPYGQALITILLLFSIVWALVNLIGHTFISANTPIQEAASGFYYSFGEYVFTVDSAKSYFTWLSIVLFTMIALQVNDKYGPGVMKDFLLGKYFHPKREERIFMFLDLRSSTTIAEKLGEERYFNFLREVFKDATVPILYAKGEIYQYVGDEIVISWKMEKGLDKANCLRCFFGIQEALRRKAGSYQKNYGIVPEFKAGLHYGYVMSGEIGIVKRDITFSGDVLNTTSRIQSMCNEMGVNILFSKYLLDKLALPPHAFDPQKMGDVFLRGKTQRLILYTIR